MTVYATDLTQLLTTVRTTLADKVGPGVTDSGARLELTMVIEQIDNLIGRTAWDPASVRRSCEQTDQLASALGLSSSSTDAGADPAAGLVERRRAVADKLRGTYTDGDVDIVATVAAVADFSVVDIQDQISVGMRGALPF